MKMREQEREREHEHKRVREREIGIETRENGVVIASGIGIGITVSGIIMGWMRRPPSKTYRGVGFILLCCFFIIPLPFSLFFSPRPRRLCSWVFHSDFLFLSSVFSLSFFCVYFCIVIALFLVIFA